MPPEISLVILNYNGVQWLDRCLESICQQTAVERLEVIITDNGSTDKSREVSERYAPRLPALRFINNGRNLWYCEANNIGAADARSPLIFILNNDLWLEPDCVAKVLEATAKTPDAHLFGIRVVNYDDDNFQGYGLAGIDWLGVGVSMPDHSQPRELFSGYGCAFVIRKDYFFKLGAYPTDFLIYGDELDLAWRVWASGGRAVTIPVARVHHRGAAVASPVGGTKHVEIQTNEMKRYLSVRNGILVVMKNAQHVFLLMLIPHLLMLCAEAAFFLATTRNWTFVRRSYLRGIADAFRMMPHVRQWRSRIKGFRQRGDFWMMRFLHFKPARLGELTQIFTKGLPKVGQKK
jgi:GT2 family glycosyltransferase